MKFKKKKFSSELKKLINEINNLKHSDIDKYLDINHRTIKLLTDNLEDPNQLINELNYFSFDDVTGFSEREIRNIKNIYLKLGSKVAENLFKEKTKRKNNKKSLYTPQHDKIELKQIVGNPVAVRQLMHSYNNKLSEIERLQSEKKLIINNFSIKPILLGIRITLSIINVLGVILIGIGSKIFSMQNPNRIYLIILCIGIILVCIHTLWVNIITKNNIPSD